ncbi:MAG: ATP-binding protein [Candidatus Sungbacteria bacterium]|nr:ATP-binding protein [Candidatus Sungbacteria bacterium]
MNFFLPAISPVFLVTLVVGVFDVFLGILVYGKNRQRFVHGIFFIFTLSVALWIAGVSMIFELPSGSQFILQGFRVAFSGAAIMTALFFHFAVIFPFRLDFIRPVHLAVLYGIAAGFVYLSIGTSTVVREIIFISDVYRAQYGFAYSFFGVYFTAAMVSAIGLIFYKLRHAPEDERPQVRLFLIGAVSALVGATTTNLFIPIVTGSSLYSRYGPLALTPFIVLTAYAIIRHKLLDVKVITTELFSGALIFFMFLQLLLSQNAAGLILNGGLFFAAIVFSFLLIRAVYKEVRDREKIADLAGELQKSNVELKKFDQAKSEFISLASHQLRTPLTVIRGYLSMIFEESFGPVSGELKKPLTNVMLSAEQLIRLVNDLLDLSRIEAGRIQYEMAAFPAADMVEKVVTALSGAARQRGIEMRFVNSAPHRLVSADFTKLSSAVMNIVDNAVKHSQARHIEITLQEKAIEGIIDISVRDDGIGIAAEDLPKLFGKFSHIGNKSRYERVTGLGIGLYFTKKVVEDHRGRVWAESAGPGKGSTFHIELPATAKGNYE